MRALRTLFVIAALAAMGILRGGAIQRASGENQAVETASESLSFDRLLSDSIDRMHKEMMFSSSGDADRDFVRMMIPHHAGAVEMAKAELIYGRNQVLRRLAQSIVIEQNQEIEIMRRALAEMSSTHNPVPGSAHEHGQQLSNGNAGKSDR
jgi:uncharacterized protein (DUF305 family)